MIDFVNRNHFPLTILLIFGFVGFLLSPIGQFRPNLLGWGVIQCILLMTVPFLTGWFMKVR